MHMMHTFFFGWETNVFLIFGHPMVLASLATSKYPVLSASNCSPRISRMVFCRQQTQIPQTWLKWIVEIVFKTHADSRKRKCLTLDVGQSLGLPADPVTVHCSLFQLARLRCADKESTCLAMQGPELCWQRQKLDLDQLLPFFFLRYHYLWSMYTLLACKHFWTRWRSVVRRGERDVLQDFLVLTEHEDPSRLFAVGT